MKGNPFSLILLPTLKCNADCEYCFESKTNDYLSLDQLSVLIDKILDYMEQNGIQGLTIYWQGGEIMTLPPQWFEQAHGIIQTAAKARNKSIQNSLQSNMIGYSQKWNKVLAEMFGNTVGSSLDFPNLHRKAVGGSPQEFNATWFEKVQEARAAGISVQIISIPNEETLAVGAERFYSYLVDELQINDFQINTPFPGGELNDAKKSFPLETEPLSRFYTDLADVWLERGYFKGVNVGPFDELIKYFIDGGGCLPCIWRENCVSGFVSIDARGYVAQCDCWVTSYPEHWFGNIFECDSFSELLQTSQARQQLQARPAVLIQQEDCLACDYLALCHGGCPVRTYTVHHRLFEIDPYCNLYKSLFEHMEQQAAKLAGARSGFWQDANAPSS